MRAAIVFGLVVAAMWVPGARGAAADADSCAGALTADSRAIYDAARGDVAGGTNIRTAVTERTRALVESGGVKRASARASAVAAGECLKLLK
jgi:hypothetical protein